MSRSPFEVGERESLCSDVSRSPFEVGEQEIDRQTGETGYQLLQELKGKFSAFMWQSIARLFGQNLKDDYDRVATRALEEKKNDILEAWFTKKIPTYYIKIDEEFKNCPEMKKWLIGVEVKK